MELKSSVHYSSENENIVNSSIKLLKTRYFPPEQYFSWNLMFFLNILLMAKVVYFPLEQYFHEILRFP